MYDLFTISIIQLSSRLQLIQVILVAPRLLPQSEPVLHFNWQGNSETESDEQIAWVNETVERIYRLLEDTRPNGAAFASAIRHIFKVGTK